MNLGLAFEKLVPVPWSEIFTLTPLERAMRFVVPLEEDRGKVSLAKTLIAEVIAARQNTAGVRWRYSGADDEKAGCFNLVASFYPACFNAARDILQAQNQAISEMWPCLEFDGTTKCHDTCRSLSKKRFPRGNVATRTFYPPWHLGCSSRVSDSDRKPSRDFTLSIRPKTMQYFHNPYDILVSQGLMGDIAGIDFGPHSSIVLDLREIQICK